MTLKTAIPELNPPQWKLLDRIVDECIGADEELVVGPNPMFDVSAHVRNELRQQIRARWKEQLK